MFAVIWAAFLIFAANQTGTQRRSQPLVVSLSALRREHTAIRNAKDSHTKALHTYRLNDAADRYAYDLNHQGGLHPDKEGDEPEVRQANRYGAFILWCSYDGDWTAGPEGYLKYLSLWPDGPDAEEAWWRGNLGHRLNFCYDGAGTEEEIAWFVHIYAEFLKHFPRGKHEREARQMLKKFRADLDEYRRPTK